MSGLETADNTMSTPNFEQLEFQSSASSLGGPLHCKGAGDLCRLRSEALAPEKESEEPHLDLTFRFSFSVFSFSVSGQG